MVQNSNLLGVMCSAIGSTCVVSLCLRLIKRLCVLHFQEKLLFLVEKSQLYRASKPAVPKLFGCWAQIRNLVSIRGPNYFVY